MAMSQRERQVRMGYATGGFVVGALLAALAALIFFNQSNPSSVKALRESDISSNSGYKFTDPLIGLTSGTGGGVTAPEYQSLQDQIQAYINAQNKNVLFSASVKFSDTEASEGFTINPNETYDPASLSKVPLMMAYYSLAQQDPQVLSDEILYTGDENLDASEQVKSPIQLLPGYTYTVEELIEHMIKYSDNNAEQLLANHLSVIGELGVLNSLFGNLGIKINSTSPDNISIQSYSLFLRVLFNATYLDRDYSEKSLDLLSQSDFSLGIESGVPNGIMVAQKFGDARIPDAQGNIVGAELQNCGIVYYPDHPYLLCIMTKGDSVTDLERVIAGISQIIYQSVEKRYSTASI